jgi:hypothetical protein
MLRTAKYLFQMFAAISVHASTACAHDLPAAPINTFASIFEQAVRTASDLDPIVPVVEKTNDFVVGAIISGVEPVNGKLKRVWRVERMKTCAPQPAATTRSSDQTTEVASPATSSVPSDLLGVRSVEITFQAPKLSVANNKTRFTSSPRAATSCHFRAGDSRTLFSYFEARVYAVLTFGKPPAPSDAKKILDPLILILGPNLEIKFSTDGAKLIVVTRSVQVLAVDLRSANF